MARTTQKARAGGVWETLARGGYVVSGVLHLLIGAAIIGIATRGGGGAEADQSTALAEIGSAPFGAVVLWVAIVAFVALGAWQLADALRSGAEASDRVKSAGRGVLYLALAVTAVTIVRGSSSGGNGDSSAQGLAGGLMQAPAGRLLVGAVGVGIVAGGAYHVVKGARQKFLEDLRSTPGGELGRGLRVLGMVGYIAKGVALAVVGVLFVSAAATADPEKAQGIDGAVESLLGLPGGPVIVALVGVGFAAYGVYSFARARYQEM